MHFMHTTIDLFTENIICKSGLFNVQSILIWDYYFHSCLSHIILSCAILSSPLFLSSYPIIPSCHFVQCLSSRSIILFGSSLPSLSYPAQSSCPVHHVLSSFPVILSCHPVLSPCPVNRLSSCPVLFCHLVVSSCPVLMFCHPVLSSCPHFPVSYTILSSLPSLSYTILTH